MLNTHVLLQGPVAGGTMFNFGDIYCGDEGVDQKQSDLEKVGAALR